MLNMVQILVVLHVHTNWDPCSRCAPTMSILSRTLNDLLLQTTRKHAYNMPLILLFSRANYQEGRFLAGHDNRYTDHFNPSESLYKNYTTSTKVYIFLFCAKWITIIVVLQIVMSGNLLDKLVRHCLTKGIFVLKSAQ